MDKIRVFLASIAVTAGAALENHLNACEYKPDHHSEIGACREEPNNPNGTKLCYLNFTGDKCTGS